MSSTPKSNFLDSLRSNSNPKQGFLDSLGSNSINPKQNFLDSLKSVNAPQIQPEPIINKQPRKSIFAFPLNDRPAITINQPVTPRVQSPQLSPSISVPRTKFTQGLPETVKPPSFLGGIGKTFGKIGQGALSLVEEIERPVQSIFRGIKEGEKVITQREEERINTLLTNPELSKARARLEIEGMDIDTAAKRLRSLLPSPNLNFDVLLRSDEKKLLQPQKSLLNKETFEGLKKGFDAPVGVRALPSIIKGEEIPFKSERMDLIPELTEALNNSPNASKFFPEGSSAREALLATGSLGIQIIADPSTWLGVGLINKGTAVSRGTAKLLREGTIGRKVVKSIRADQLDEIADAVKKINFDDVSKQVNTVEDIVPRPSIVDETNKLVDDAILKQRQGVEDLRFRRSIGGEPLTDEIAKAEQGLVVLERRKNLPFLEEQLQRLEDTQRVMFQSNQQLTPEFSELSDKITVLKRNITEASSKFRLPDIIDQPISRQASQNLRVEAPKITAPTSEIENIIDTKSFIGQPTRVKRQPLSGTAEDIYQEVVSKNIPFESIGGRPNIEASNINRVSGAIEYNTLHKQTDLLGNEVGDSIREILNKVGAERMDDFNDYILQVHNVDRVKQGKNIFGGTGIPDELILKQNLDAARRYEAANPDFRQLLQAQTKYFDNLLNIQTSSGLASEETAGLLRGVYQNYTPAATSNEFSHISRSTNANVAKLVKSATEGAGNVMPLQEQMLIATERTLRNANQNIVMNSLDDLFQKGSPKIKKYVLDISDAKNVAKIDDITDIGKALETRESIGKNFIVNYYKDGVQKQMTVNKNLFKALDNTISDTGINRLANVVRKYATGPFKKLVTQYNPLFGAANIARDVPTALSYSDDPIKMAAKVPEAVKEMATNGPLFRKYKAVGGMREGLIGSNKTFTIADFNKFANKNQNIFNKVENLNNITETLPRFAEFLAVFEKTGDVGLALYKSAELTVDFSRFGRSTKLLDAFVPYLNASVQGIDRFGRAMIKDPIKTAVKGGIAITAPTVILDYINKDNKAYQQLTPRERNLYYQIPIPGSENFLRVPKSRELGVLFSSVYEWAARSARGEKVTGKEISDTISENFTPVDGFESNILAPIMKAWNQTKNPDAYETNYFGGLIVPESMRDLSPELQYDPSSSSIAKDLGEALKMSPKVIDYLIKSYTGIGGQIIQPLTTAKGATILEPLKNRFITDPVFKSDSINKFYEELNKTRREANDFNVRNDIAPGDVTTLESFASSMNKVSTLLTQRRKKQRKIEDSDLSTAEKKEQVRELQIEMNEIAQNALEKFFSTPKLK